MSVKIYRLKGTYGNKRNLSEFKKEIRATNESEAKERLYSELGSKHRIKRHLIKITYSEVIESNESIKDPIVKALTKSD